MQDIRSMQIGHVVDFVIDYNERNKSEDEKKKEPPKKHRATQAEIDAFFG